MKDDDERAGAADDPPVGNRGGGVVSTCMRDDERAGSVQPATHSISVKGGNPEVIKRHSRANQSSSELMSDSLDLGARRRREQRVQVRQLLTQQHLWVGRGAVMSACMQGRARKIVALALPHLEVLRGSHQRRPRGNQEVIRDYQRDRTSRFSSLRLPPASRLAPVEAAAAELEVARADEIDETGAPDAPVAGAAAACTNAASRCRAACALSQSRVGAAAATAVSGREDAAVNPEDAAVNPEDAAAAEDAAVNPEDAAEGAAGADGGEKDGGGGGVASAAASARVGAAPSSVDGESLCEVRRRAGEPACGPKKTGWRDVRASVAAGVGPTGGGSDGSTGSTGARASAGAGGGIDRGGERVVARGGSGAGS